MYSKKTAGFTVIESILFLAVSSLLIGGILAGVNSSINIQRYRDAVTSLHGFIQSEYDLVINAQNNRPSGNLRCSAGVVTTDKATTNIARGASDCFILGRYLRVSSDGRRINASNVYATTDVAKIPVGDSRRPSNDKEAFLASGLAISNLTEDKSEYNLEWQTVLSGPRTQSVQNLHLLIARSPTSGLVHTYSLDTTSAAGLNEVVSSTKTGDNIICVNTADLARERLSVVIQADSPNSSGVKQSGGEPCA